MNCFYSTTGEYNCYSTTIEHFNTCPSGQVLTSDNNLCCPTDREFTYVTTGQGYVSKGCSSKYSSVSATISPSTIIDELNVSHHKNNNGKWDCYTAYPTHVGDKCYEKVGKCRDSQGVLTGQTPTSDHKCNTCSSGQVLFNNYTQCASCPVTYNFSVSQGKCVRTTIDTTPAIIN
jgi:hypothetical protein